MQAVELEKRNFITNVAEITFNAATDIQGNVAFNKPVPASPSIGSAMPRINENFHEEVPLIAAKVRMPLGVRIERVPLSKLT